MTDKAPYKFKLDNDPFNPNEWCQKIIREVNETEEAFIFSTIKPFVDSITTMEISKEELARAISLIRLQREALTRYGSMLSNDWDTAIRQMAELNSAYIRGLQDGVERARNEIKEYLGELKNECNNNR